MKHIPTSQSTHISSQKSTEVSANKRLTRPEFCWLGQAVGFTAHISHDPQVLYIHLYTAESPKRVSKGAIVLGEISSPFLLHE